MSDIKCKCGHAMADHWGGKESCGELECVTCEKFEPAEPSPEVAPTHPDLCDCATCWQAIAEARRRTILKREAEITNLLAVPAVAPRETQTELRIPSDLAYEYEYAKRAGESYLCPGYLVIKLIERIARLEGDR